MKEKKSQIKAGNINKQTNRQKRKYTKKKKNQVELLRLIFADDKLELE